MMKKSSVFKKCIYLFGFIFVMTVLVGCAGSDDWTSDWETATVPAPETRVVSEEAETAADVGEEGVLRSIPILLPDESGRQLVYTVDFNIQTTEFMEGMRLLLDTVGEMGGYSELVIVNGRCLLQEHVRRDADFVFRIPNTQLAEFLVFIEGNYNIVGLSKRLRDFTLAYERNEKDLEDLREQEQRLLDQLDDEDEAVYVSEAELADIRSQIRDLEESNVIIGHDVDYSDVSVRLNEVIIFEEVSETFGDRLQRTFDDALDNLFVVLEVAVFIVVTILPWGVVAILIGIPVIYVSKKRKKKDSSDEMLGE